MKRIMIGNDINLKYSVFADHTPEDLSNLKEIKVWLRHETIKALQIEPVFTIVGNVISMDVHAGLHKRTGAYRLFIIYKKNNPSRIPDYDSKSIAQLAFTLVETTEESGGDSVCPELEPITVELSGDVGFGSSSGGNGDVSVDGDSVILVNGKLKVNVVDSADYESAGYNSSTRPPSARQIKIIRELLKTNYVQKETGKGLSSNDYSTNEKNKLGGVEAEANKYTHPSSHPASMISENESRRFVTDVEKQDWADKYSKVDVDNKISAVTSGLNWKPMVPTFDDLALLYPDAVDGWTATTVDPDNTYRFDGANWIPISANATPKASQTVDGLMSKEDKNKLSGVAAGAEVNVNPDWNATEGKTQILNKPDVSASIESAVSPLRIKINKIITTGVGTNFLADDGTYKSTESSINIVDEENKCGVFNFGGEIHDIYEIAIELLDLPSSAGTTKEYVISSDPLGYGLYCDIDSFSISAGKNIKSLFYNGSYEVVRIYVDQTTMETKVIIKCKEATVSSLKALVHIRYIKFFGDIVEFTTTIPAGVDPESVTFEFPKLKYNKQRVFTFVHDDSVTIWNNLFNLINRKYVSDETGINPWSGASGWTFFFHKGMTAGDYSSDGYVPDHFCEGTDGTGIKHRFAATVASWHWKMNGRDELGGSQWPWWTPSEMRIMQDFGFTVAYHDVADGIDIPDQATFDEYLKSCMDAFYEKIDRNPKTLAEPGGDHRYINYVQNNSQTQIIVAQSGDGRIIKVYPFSNGFTLDKEDVTVMRYFGETADAVISYLQSQTGDGREWIINGQHRVNYEANADSIWTKLNQNFGAIGDDSIWVPSFDEMYEWWFMRTNSVVVKSISGQTINYKIFISALDNFWFRSISCLLTGISSLTGVSVTSSDNCAGTSFAINDGKLLVNLDFNPDLIPKVEKYVSQFESSQNTFDYEDALYFASMLKVGLKETYLNRLSQPSTVPVLSSMLINSGNSVTTSRTVTLVASYTGSATHYMVSESASFTGATWETVVSNIPFIISDIVGDHTIYLKLKNNSGESSIVSDTIEFQIVAFDLNSVSINSGALETTAQAVSIAFNVTGTPTHYMLSESTTFAGASWIIYVNPASFQLSSGNASKTVYAKVKNASSESSVVSDTITLNISSQEIKVVISVNKTGVENNNVFYDTTTVNTINRINHAAHTSFSKKQLKSISGEIVPFYMELNSSFFQPNSETITDSPFTNDSLFAPSLSGNSGVYPDLFIQQAALLGGDSYDYANGVVSARKARLVFTLPNGTFKFKIIWSVNSGGTVDAINLPFCLYRIDASGVIGTPVQAGPEGFTALNNTNFNAEINAVVLNGGVAGNVIFYMYNNKPAEYGYRPGINLIEITKVS